MAGTDRYLNGLRQLRKRRGGGDGADAREGIRNAFFAALPECPESLAWDLFNYFEERMSGMMDGKTDFLDAAKILADVIDLFEYNYDDERGELNDDDWRFVKESVSEAALELPDKLLTYVLGKVVDRGLFD